MNDPFDPIIDKAIEEEKQQALRQFQLSPFRPQPNQTTKWTGDSLFIGLTRAWIWGGCAAMLLLAFSVVLIMHYQGQLLTENLSSRTVEQALLSAQKNQFKPGLLDSPLFMDDKAGSDLSWNIQSIICRVRRSQYPQQDLSEAVMRTLSKRAAHPYAFAESNSGMVQGLDDKLRHLSSKNAIALVLSKPRPR